MFLLGNRTARNLPSNMIYLNPLEPLQ